MKIHTLEWKSVGCFQVTKAVFMSLNTKPKWLLLFFIARFIEDWFICGRKSMFRRCKTDKKLQQGTNAHTSIIETSLFMYVALNDRYGEIARGSAEKFGFFPFQIKRRRKSDIEKVLHAWGEQEKKRKLKVNRRQPKIFHLFIAPNLFFGRFLLAGFLH